MQPEERNELSDPSSTESEATIPSSADAAPEPDSLAESSLSWNRRSFLKAAVLGTAAAALINSDRVGLHFGPLSAYADDLSGLNCTANDVRIPGPAVVLNEPCICSGTFNANVQFRVVNNTGTTRYCVTVHFCPVTLPGGGTFDPGDIIIGDVPPKSDALYTVTIPNFPCGAGLLCFGARGSEEDGGFPKGAACPTGQCCTTISWDVNPGCPTRTLTSKCRHQQVCIQSFGATLTCVNNCTDKTPTNCSVACGATLSLLATASGSTAGATAGSYKFKLQRPGGAVVYESLSFESSPKCLTDTAPVTGTYTLTVTDTQNCTRTATTNVTVSAVTATLTETTPAATCSTGTRTFSAASSGTGCTFEFLVDGTVAQAASSTSTFTYDPIALARARPAFVPFNACHTVRVNASCNGGACTANASKHFTDCVTLGTTATGACP
jgi:hypothetical protein